MKARQGGAVLVVSMVLLVVALLLGLSSAQSSRLEEAMAGNQRAAIMATMLAEFGAAREIERGFSGIAPCTFNPATLSPSEWSEADFEMEDTILEGVGNYRHFACLSPGGNVVYLYIAGAFGDTDRKLRVTYLMPGGFLNFSPITIPANLSAFQSPNSNGFEVEGENVDGVFQYAVSTSGQKELVESSIKDNRLDNYRGGISDSIGESVLADENITTFVDFINALKGIANGDGNGSGQCVGTCTCGGFGTPLSSIDSESCVTYVPGSYADSGNFSGSGIMIVEGDLLLSGTPEFDGLVIVLGETYSLSGGGNGGVNGSLLLANYETNEAGPYYADMDVTVAGGGNASYRYDAVALDNAFSLLAGTPAETIWNSAGGGANGAVGIEKWQFSTR